VGVTLQNWANYSGSLTFSIYKATDLQAPGYTPGNTLTGTACDSYYTKGTASKTFTLAGNDATGIAITNLTSGHVYAFETSLGPWSNNGSPSYEIAIKEIGGDGNWYKLSDFASGACAESPDGNHVLIYFQALAGRTYGFRVYDPGDNYADNTGSINLVEYDSVVVGIAPWSTCADNYNLTQIPVGDTTIPTTGIALPITKTGPSVNISSMKAGSTYAIEISQDAWWYSVNAPNDHYYESDISKDNGSNWEQFGWRQGAIGNTFGATCVIKTNQNPGRLFIHLPNIFHSRGRCLSNAGGCNG